MPGTSSNSLYCQGLIVCTFTNDIVAYTFSVWHLSWLLPANSWGRLYTKVGVPEIALIFHYLLSNYKQVLFPFCALVCLLLFCLGFRSLAPDCWCNCLQHVSAWEHQCEDMFDLQKCVVRSACPNTENDHLHGAHQKVRSILLVCSMHR